MESNPAVLPKPSLIESLRLKLSARLLARLLRLAPDGALLARMGLIQLRLGRIDEAIDHLQRSISAVPNDPYAHYNLGRALAAAGRDKEALRSYDRALALGSDLDAAPGSGLAEAKEARTQLGERLRKPGAASGGANHGGAEVQALYDKALALHRQGKVSEAARLYARILKSQPRHAASLHMQGIIALKKGEWQRAADLIARAIDNDPGESDFHNNLGLARQSLGQYQEAVASYDRALAIQPGFAQCWCNRGDALMSAGRAAEAAASYDRCIAIEPGLIEAHLNRGYALQELGLLDEALESFDKALAIDAGSTQAWTNRGNALAALRRFDEALESLGRALKLAPGSAEALINQGNVLQQLSRRSEALAAYEKAHRLRPEHDFLLGNVLGARLMLCDWRDHASLVNRVQARVKRGERAINPFSFLAVSDSPLLERKAAEAWAAFRYPARPAEPFSTRKAASKLRIGYFSSDYHHHATSYLMAGLLEAHDRSRFEIIGLSFDRHPEDDMRRRVVAACDRFIDVSVQGDEAVCAMSRELGIDIAVDLKGYTADARTAIFSGRAAPIQVNWLGYPGTLGAAYFDYLIADRTLIAPEEESHYTERVVRLPHTYQPNDDKRAIAATAMTRAEAGLPESGFVFSSFCNNFKIQPAMFDSWMRLLSAVEGSVLWLIEDNETVADNLRREAKVRGIDPSRLVFARRIALDAHLARHRLADLFVDTFPYGAHTTASDALWAGLPLVTLAGESFASRVAASLLQAVGLPELVTQSAADYEALALALARDPQRLAGLRARLVAQRSASPLFDTRGFARHIEQAYLHMAERQRDGLPPASFDIPA